jgi:hypothetical protein
MRAVGWRARRLYDGDGEQSAAVVRNVLVVAGAGAEKGAELIVSSTEPLGGPEGLEAAHTSCAPFHAAVVLLQPVVLVGAGPVLDVAAQGRADRARIGAVPVRGDAVGDQAGGGLGRAEEGLGGRHVPVPAEQGVDQVAVAVDRAIQVAPPAPDPQVFRQRATSAARPRPCRADAAEVRRSGRG